MLRGGSIALQLVEWNLRDTIFGKKKSCRYNRERAQKRRINSTVKGQEPARSRTEKITY
jgi:hypothetical protein